MKECGEDDAIMKRAFEFMIIVDEVDSITMSSIAGFLEKESNCL